MQLVERRPGGGSAGRPRHISGAVLRLGVAAVGPVDGSNHLDRALPHAVAGDLGCERDGALVDAVTDPVRAQPRLANERAAAVAEHEPVGLDLSIRAALLDDLCVLHLEEVGEVRVDLHADRHLHRLGAVVHDLQLLVEPAVADQSPPPHGERRVRIGRARAGNQEELRVEVLQIVRREQLERLPVDRQTADARGSACPGERDRVARTASRRRRRCAR